MTPWIRDFEQVLRTRRSLWSDQSSNRSAVCPTTVRPVVVAGTRGIHGMNRGAPRMLRELRAFVDAAGTTDRIDLCRFG